VNGISLPEFAAVLTGVGGLLGAIFLYASKQSAAQNSAHEGRIKDLQKALDEVRKDGDERIAELRRDFERQLTDVKQAMTHQSQVIDRQEIMLSDYARHVSKLERLMAAKGMEIPDFETSHLRSGHNAQT